MADAKITQLNELVATPADDDLLVIVDDPSGSPETKKITYSNSGISSNNSHRSGDGSDHANVALNDAHRVSDGRDHSDVVLNNTHRTSDGSDHTFIDQDVTIGSAPVLDASNFTNMPDQFRKHYFQGDMFENPVNGDWVVNDIAEPAIDTNNAALTVRLFSDADEDGVGFSLLVPSTATNLTLKIISRSETGASGNVVPQLYARDIGDNSTPSAWSSATVLTTIALPANENWHYDTDSIALSTLGITAGNVAQFEFTRDGNDVDDTLGATWTVLGLEVSYT